MFLPRTVKIPPPAPFRRGQKGFSLAELLVVLAISSVASTATYSFYLASIRTYERQNEAIRVQMNVRASLDLLVRELRMAGFDPTAAAGAGFGACSRHEVNYSADFSADGTIDPGEQVGIRFYPGEGVIKRKSSAVAGNSFQPMFREIEAAEFVYRLADGSSVADPPDPASIRAVEIRIRGKNCANWESSLAICRNLGGGADEGSPHE